jgi:hypothetical protein
MYFTLITEACGDEDVPRCSLGEGANHGRRGVSYHKGYATTRKLTFFSVSILHEVRAQSLVVDLKDGLQTLTVFPRGKSQVECLWVTLAV